MMHASFSILGAAAVVPSREVLSREIDEILGMSPGWTEKFSGVRCRAWVSNETLSSMGAQAARQALDEAQMKASQIDLLIFAGASFEQLLPCTAAFVLRELGIRGIAGVDVNSTCLSFLSALDAAISYLQTGRYRRILLVNAEIASGHLNQEHHESFALFGDGAAAFVLAPPQPEGLGQFTALASRHETYPEEIEACGVMGGGSRLPVFLYTEENAKDFRFFMDGPRLFAKSDALVLPFFDRLLGPLGTSLADLDWVVPHQASGMAMRLMRRRLGIAKDRWIDILPSHGNQISVSIPTAFVHLLRSNRLQPTNTVLLCGTGAGLGLGAILLRMEPQG